MNSQTNNNYDDKNDDSLNIDYSGNSANQGNSSNNYQNNSNSYSNNNSYNNSEFKKEELPWEKNEREKKENEQSFMSKYWMLVVLLVLLIILPFTVLKINFSHLLHTNNSSNNITLNISKTTNKTTNTISTTTVASIVNNNYKYLSLNSKNLTTSQIDSIFNLSPSQEKFTQNSTFVAIYNGSGNFTKQLNKNFFFIGNLSKLLIIFTSTFPNLNNNISTAYYTSYLTSLNYTNINLHELSFSQTFFITQKPLLVYSDLLSTDVLKKSNLTYDGLNYIVSNATNGNGSGLTSNQLTYNIIAYKNDVVSDTTISVTTPVGTKQYAINETKAINYILNLS